MVRVCVLLLFPLAFLPGCTTGLAQAPINSPERASPPPANEGFADCAKKNSVIDAWSCISKDDAAQ
jgi:hypothetical protein